MNEFANPSTRIQSLWREADQVEYRRGEISGSCLSLVSTLSLESLPWDSALPPSGTNDDDILCVKRSNSRCVLTFTVPSSDNQPVRLFVKRCKARGGIKRLFSPFRLSKSRREFDLGWRLKDRGLPTAFPMLWADRRKNGFLIESYLITLGIDHSFSFAMLFRTLPDAKQRTLWLRKLGAFIRQAHEKGFAHDDLNAEHVLISMDAPGSSPAPSNPAEKTSFHFIDLDQSRLGQTAVKPFRRAHNFFQIFRSLPDEFFGPEERRDFFAGYSNDEWGEEHIATLEKTIELIQTQKKVMKFFKKKTWFGS